MVSSSNAVRQPQAGASNGADIRIEQVSHQFDGPAGTLPVVDGVSLHIRPGEFVALLGPSGCGKSTLLRLVAGLEPPSAGQILHDGEPVARPDPSRIVVFQDPTLFPWRTVRDNVALGPQARGTLAALQPRVEAALKLVGLQDFAKAYPHQLSGGMAQRVALARAIVNDPSLLVLDEPLGKLDSLTRLTMQTELLALWQRQGFSALLVTHDVEEAFFLAQRVIVLSDRPSRIVAELVNELPYPRHRGDPRLAELCATRPWPTWAWTRAGEGCAWGRAERVIDWTPTPEQVNTVLGVLYAVQDALHRLWFALGLSDSLAGQPVWPWAQRLHGELMVFEPGQARRLLLCAAALAIALPLTGLAVFWRRARWPAWAAAVALLAAAPWGVFGLLAGPATPSSFHVSDSGFSAQTIVRGQTVYQRHCQRCHAADGGGEGPDAPALPMWPPRLNGSLLWQRLEGELWWRVRHGLQDRDGQTTMPGFADALSEADTWNVLDFLQAQASGQTLAREGRWELPVRLPDARVRCGVASELRSLRGMQGQRLLVAASPGTPLVLDPRVLGIGQGSGLAEAGTDCRLVEADAADFRQALALVLGQPVARLQGQQVLVDRQGWLRARALPGQSWSAADLVCRSEKAPAPAAPAPELPAPTDPLGALVAAMDADPVAPRRGGIPH